MNFPETRMRSLNKIGIAGDFVRAFNYLNANPMMILQGYHPFWNGPFSQWEFSVFIVDIENQPTKFNCAEQFMMFGKAKLFGDDLALEKIMMSSSPREQKALGRRVLGFDEDVWNEVARDIVLIGSLAKYEYNPDLDRQLQETAPKYLVEASPYDKIWGVGLAPDDPAVHSKANWQGTNWLGEVLNKTRFLRSRGFSLRN